MKGIVAAFIVMLTAFAAHAAVSSPLNISSDVLEIYQSKSSAVFEGDVKATQENMELMAERLEVSYNNTNNISDDQHSDIDTITAIGKVSVSNGTDIAKGDLAIYETTKKEINLTGNVSLKRGENTITGHKLVYDLVSGKMRMANEDTATQNVKKGRVKATFTPTAN